MARAIKVFFVYYGMMKTYLTQMKAVDAYDGELKTFVGEMVQAFSQGEAQEWCFENKPYLQVVGEVEEIRDIDGNLIEDVKNAKLN